MKNLFNFSKIVAILLPVLFAIRMLSLLFLPENILKIIGEIYGYSIFFTWLIWFSLIITAAVKKSPLKAPAYIGILSCLLIILSYIIRLSLSYDELINSSPKVYIAGVAKITYVIIFSIAMCWICRYFEKKSKVKILSIFIVILPIVLYFVYCINLFIVTKSNSELKLIYSYVSIVEYILQIVLYAWFFFEFYKISKCKDNTFIKALTLDKESFKKD